MVQDEKTRSSSGKDVYISCVFSAGLAPQVGTGPTRKRIIVQTILEILNRLASNLDFVSPISLYRIVTPP